MKLTLEENSLFRSRSDLLGKGFDDLLESRGSGRITSYVGKVTLWRGKAAARCSGWVSSLCVGEGSKVP